MRFDEQGGQPVSVAPNVFAYGAPSSRVICAISAGGHEIGHHAADFDAAR